MIEPEKLYASIRYCNNESQLRIDLKNAERELGYSKPRMASIPGSHNYEKIGEAYNINPELLQFIFDKIKDDPHQQLKEVFDQLLFISKLVYPEVFSTFEQFVHNRKTSFENASIVWEKKRAEYFIKKEEYKNRSSEILDHQKIFIEIIDNLEKLDIKYEHQLRCFPIYEMVIFNTIYKLSRHIILDNDIIKANWSALRQPLHPEHLANIYRHIIKNLKDEGFIQL